MRHAVSALADAPPRLPVAAEILLACVALVCAVLMVHGALKVAKARRGHWNESVLTGRVGLLASNNPIETDCARLLSGLLHRIDVMPGATRVAASMSLPSAASSGHGSLRWGESQPSDTHASLARFVARSPGSCGVPDMPLLAGRFPRPSDGSDTEPATFRTLKTERKSGEWEAGGRRLQVAAGGRTSLRTE